jgi:hypothetical protein
MRDFLFLNANRLSFIIISILLISEVIAVVKEQSIWNIVYVIMLSISWLSFFLLVLVKPKKVEE